MMTNNISIKLIYDFPAWKATRYKENLNKFKTLTGANFKIKNTY